jgi:hypothetical protein
MEKLTFPLRVPSMALPIYRPEDNVSSRLLEHKKADSRQRLLEYSHNNSNHHAATTSNFLYRHRHFFYASPAVLAGVLWASMMVYFEIYYQTLSRDSSGHLPRIGDAYSTFPYISCIGATRLSYFRGFATTVAFLVSTAFFLDFYLGRVVQPGRWFRLSKFLFGIISSAFLVALSFESVNSSNHLHLIFTSIQIWCMGLAKLSDYFLSYCMRRHDRGNPHLLFAKLWKKCVGCVAARTWSRF